MRRNAVTLLETLIVIIIISIIAAIAVPVYTNRIERTRGERAIVNIELIVDAIRMYYVKYDINLYGDSTNVPNTLGDINDTLDLDLKDDQFDYEIVYIESGGGVLAARNSGVYDDYYMKYNASLPMSDQDGWDPDSNWPWMPLIK